MGVSHLGHHANRANAMQVNKSSKDSKQVLSPLNSRPASTSGTTRLPNAPGVESFSNAALRGSSAPAQPAHGGARAGQKSGNGNLGASGGQPGKSGGRL